MKKRIFSLLLTVAMLLTTLVMVVPASAAATETLKTKGYLLAVRSEPNSNNPTTSTANGMSMIFLLKDGTFIVYDGGGCLNAEDAAHLKSQLQSISTNHGLDPNNIVVSLWMFSHPHEDHVGFLKDWNSYKSGVTVKEIWYNHLSANAANDSIYQRIRTVYPNTPIRAVYPGEEYDYADVHMKILYSADMRSGSPTYNKSNFSGTGANYTDLYGTSSTGTHADGNNSSTILRMDIENTSILLTGDAGWKPFEYVYENYKADMDVDIFQVSHHGVGSASATAGHIYSTPNNKHFAAITPTTILIPAGRGVVNMTLNGSRAYIKNDVVQSWNNGSTEQDYDGYYKLYRDFGVVSAAGNDTFSASELKNNQSKTTNGKTYYIAGQLNVDSGIKTIQEFYTSKGYNFTLATEMLDGAAVRCVPDGASGLRFLSTVPVETLENAEALLTAGAISGYSFGTVIFKASSVSKLNGEISVAALEAAGEQYVDIEAKDGIRDNGDGSKTISAALVNIKEKNYGLSLAAVSYIEYHLTSGRVLRAYSAFDSQENVRSVGEVARKALADVTDTKGSVVQDGIYYIYKHLITDPTDENYGKYSLYSEAQRAILKKYAQANDDTMAGFDRDDLGYDIWS